MAKILLVITLIQIVLVTGEEYLTTRNTPPANDNNINGNPGHAVKTIQDVCAIFQIAPVNCSCELFTINGSNAFPNLCELQKHLNKPIQTLRYSAELSRAYAGITVIASIVGIIGNVAVVLVAFRKRRNLPKCQRVISHLALSDLLFAVVQLFVAITCFWTNKWLYGIFMCKMLRGGMVLGGLLTIGFILLIAVERYFGIVRPLEKGLSSSNINLCVAGNIIAAVATIIPLLVVLDVKEMGRCGERWPNPNRDSDIYTMFLLIFYFVIPVAIIFLLYIRIMINLNKNKTQKVISNEVDKRKRLKDNRRAIYILIAVLVAFVVCILPNRIVWVYLDAVDYKVDKTLYMVLAYIGLVTFPIHVAVNPIIYSVVDRRWRRDIIRVLTCEKERLPSVTSSIVRLSKYSADQDCISTNKSYVEALKNLKIRKDEKGRNMSVDYGTHLLSYIPNQFALPATEINDNVDLNDVFVENNNRSN